MEGEKEYIKKKETTIIKLKSAKQVDGFNCGIFFLFFMDYFLNLKNDVLENFNEEEKKKFSNFEITPADLKEKRESILIQVLEDSLNYLENKKKNKTKTK